ncbi:MAG: sigma-70 family RNA polymerase sigma factor [Clostridia bacterium]|nr:sigma-70 family RNA polymerase sigma factor [Clostridia bacterium]
MTPPAGGPEPLAPSRAGGGGGAEEGWLRDLAPVVRQAARRFAASGAPFADLEQAGYLGALEAVRRYDPARGTPLRAFATPFVLAEMRRAAQELLPGPDVGRRAVRRRNEIRAAEERLAQELGRAPTAREVAAALGIPVDELASLLSALRPPEPLSGDGEEDGRDRPPREPASPSFEEAWLARAEVRRALARLPERERRLLWLRYAAGLSQTEAAARLGVSQSQVSRLERRALRLARAALEGRAV